ncbi:MAG: hypothetical protein J6B00_01725 [Alphaproteobacteria bacterium]|nr:hypothetical protein [Alphaproteobacteria bacterium]MBP3687588.1 hypothetical protein [Alphaproteobacteria bacterium]
MKTKTLFCIIGAVLLLPLVLGCWKFVLGFACASFIFWHFGEAKVKKSMRAAFDKTKDVVNEVQNDLKETL